MGEQDSNRLMHIRRREAQVKALHEQLVSAESTASGEKNSADDVLSLRLRLAAAESERQCLEDAAKRAEQQLAMMRNELAQAQSPLPSPRSLQNHQTRARSFSPRRMVEIAGDPINEIPESWNSSSFRTKLTVVSSALALGAVLVSASRGRM